MPVQVVHHNLHPSATPICPSLGRFLSEVLGSLDRPWSEAGGHGMQMSEAESNRAIRKDIGEAPHMLELVGPNFPNARGFSTHRFSQALTRFWSRRRKEPPQCGGRKRVRRTCAFRGEQMIDIGLIRHLRRARREGRQGVLRARARSGCFGSGRTCFSRKGTCPSKRKRRHMQVVISLHLQVPPQMVFRPSKPIPNTFSEGTWRPRVYVNYI